jgi:nitrogen regulatory protein PII
VPSENRKLVTIITEAVIESTLCKVLEDLGAHGYTITNARGSGSRGVRNADWSSSGNIRIEIVCDEAVANRIETHLKEHYYDDFAMILFESNVRVLRPDKF